MLLLYLFQTLPQLLPRTTIDFTCRMGETMVKEIELSNPARKAIAYTARLEGHADFSIDASVVRVGAGETTRLPCKCTPTTSLPQEARLVLMSKRDGGGAYAATLVFLLRSAVNTRAPLKRVRTEGPLYEMQQFEFTVSNPFKTDCDFAITLQHEQAEPPPPPPADDKKRGRRPGAGNGGNKAGAGAPAQGGASTQPASAKLFPAAFGLDRGRVRLKANRCGLLHASPLLHAPLLLTPLHCFKVSHALSSIWCCASVPRHTPCCAALRSCAPASCPSTWARTTAPSCSRTRSRCGAMSTRPTRPTPAPAWASWRGDQTSALARAHVCTGAQGEFVYELVGEALLPAPIMEVRGVVPLEGPNQTLDVLVPLANTQVRSLGTHENGAVSDARRLASRS